MIYKKPSNSVPNSKDDNNEMSWVASKTPFEVARKT